MTIALTDLLPQDLSKGPPLPKVLNIAWPSWLLSLLGVAVAPAAAPAAAAAAPTTPAGTTQVAQPTAATSPAGTTQVAQPTAATSPAGTTQVTQPTVAAAEAAAPAAEVAEVPTTPVKLTAESASTPEVYAAKCPPVLYKVKGYDNGNYVTVYVLALNSSDAKAASGLRAPTASSQSGTAASQTYHTTGQLPAGTIIASAERIAEVQVAQAAAKAAQTAAATALSEATKAYQTLSSSVRTAMSLIIFPPARSLTATEKQKVAAFQALPAAQRAAAWRLYETYLAASGDTAGAAKAAAEAAKAQAEAVVPPLPVTRVEEAAPAPTPPVTIPGITYAIITSLTGLATVARGKTFSVGGVITNYDSKSHTGRLTVWFGEPGNPKAVKLVIIPERQLTITPGLYRFGGSVTVPTNWTAGSYPYSGLFVDTSVIPYKSSKLEKSVTIT